MFKKYLHFTFRNLKRNPGYLSINIIGLAVGVATVLLIFLYVQHEMSYDQFHEKKDRIHRMISYSGFTEKNWVSYVAGDPIPEMRESYTEVEDAAKFMNCGSDFVGIEGTRFEDISMFCGEPNLFNIFSLNLISGNAESLNAPNTAVITRSLAERFFGRENPVGKTFPVNFSGDSLTTFEITGLMEDVPTNSHFRFDIMISYESLRSTNRCLTCGQAMYVLLHENANEDAVASRALKYIREIDGRDYVEDIKLEPITEVYFSEILENPQGNYQYVLIMIAIAILVLFIGCANYMNLATARFSQRSKEIGVRKVLGAYRLELMKQFYLETIILTLLALPLAVILLTIGLPYFNELADTELSQNWLSNFWIYAATFSLLIFIGLIAGSYPALFLSSFKPSEVIKGTLKPSFSATGIRKALVVFQFMIAIIMIVVTGIIMQQLNFIQEKSLGFDSDQVVVAKMGDPSFTTKYKLVQEEFKKIASVKHVSASYGLPMAKGGAHFIHEVDNVPIEFVTPTIDYELVETLDLQLLAGRNISDIIPAKGREGLINLSGVNAMGWESPNDAVDQTIGHYRIVGVVNDFHIKPLHEKIQPVIMSQNQWGSMHTLLIKNEGGNITNTLESLQNAWSELGTTGPLEVTFVDDQINQLYESEQKTAKIIGIFASLAIFVGCLGLFGLATFMTERRIKEIAVRKVLGASVSNVLVLLSKDFGKLILISLLAAAPVAYIISNKWLENFAYKIDIGFGVFIVSGVFVLLITLFSTGIKSARAATNNPVNSLRS